MSVFVTPWQTEMTATHSLLSVFILFISARVSEAAVDRRFSDLKRCADEECSMLLCRGKASQDFVGPDCRFLSFKTGETIYVYYKLSGQRSDVWAGSVGNSFGYFHKDFLNVNHIYTEKEIEVPAEETDFVCFDTGLDQFESYDIDILLGNVFSDQADEPGDKPEESNVPSEDVETDKPSRVVDSNPDSSPTLGQDEGRVPDSETTLQSGKDQDHYVINEVGESTPERVQDDPSSSPPMDGSASEESTHTTQVEAVSELKTTLGATFDAVATDDEDTRKVTPNDDDPDDEDLREGLVPNVEQEPTKEPSLLTFEQKRHDVPEETNDEKESEDAAESREMDDPGKDVSVNSPPTEGGETGHVDDREGHLRDPELAQVQIETSPSDKKEEENAAPEKPVPDGASSSPSEDDGGLEESARTTEVEIEVPEAQTTFGTTFDAVTTDDENTLKVSTEDDDGDEDIVQQVDEEESVKEPSLLTFEEKPQDDSVWSTLGDRVFKIVSGGERTDGTKDDDDEEEEEEEEEEKKEPQTKPDAEPGLQNASSVPASKTSDGMEEQNANVSNKNNDSEEMKGVTSDLDDDLVSPESEPEPQSLEKHPNPSETKLLEPDPLTKEGSSKVPDLEERTDEQIQRVKHEIIDLFKGTLESENPKTESQIDEDEDEAPEKLLEDENAISATAQVSEEPLVESLEPVMEEKIDVVSEEEPELKDDEKRDRDENPGEESEAVGETRTDPVLDRHPEYDESILRLTLLRDRFNDDEIGRMLRHLTIKDLYKVEAMFTELDQRLNSAKQAHPDSSEELERALESVMEVSENAILDAIDGMLDTREKKAVQLGQQIDQSVLDEESAVLDDFQEFTFYLHQKYSSVPLVEDDNPSHGENTSDVSDTSEEVESPAESLPLSDLTEKSKLYQEPGESFTETPQVDDPQSQEATPPEEDSGRFNKNHQDIQTSFQDATEISRGPQAILDTPLDVLAFEIEPSDSQDSSKSPSDFTSNNANYEEVSTSDHVRDLYLLASKVFGVYVEILIAALPEEWRPGPTFHGLPWKPVVVTAVIGILTMLVFLWRTILAVKSKSYLLTEKQLAEKIQQLISEKSEVLKKVSELNNTIKQHEEKLSNSEESRSSQQKEFLELKKNYRDLNEQKGKLSTKFARLCEQITNAQEENKTLNEKMSTMNERVQEYQKTLKMYNEERAKAQVLMDEAKLREDALKAQVHSFEKDNCALKERKKSLLQDAKEWQEKHERLRDEIKVYHKTQTELENTLVHKENEIEVLSGCIAELKSLEACNDAALENDKNGDPLKLHLKQMMDVSRVSMERNAVALVNDQKEPNVQKIKATLSVIEDERNRWFENFMTEQKARQELEEKYQKVMHDQTNLKNENTHLENQYKNLQQRLEITTELYHQKENILHQKLTQEELERHEKESKLSEVDGQALQAEEELTRLRQKVKDMQEEMQQNERSLKAEIAVQEKKAHENWLKARASERALIEERRECANLRQKIVECSDKMSDLEHTLYKSGPPEHHISHRGDSYGPSPVSGGAPSPPLMMEDPGRPLSGRRSETFGPRLLLDGHGRSSDLGHPLPFRPELSGPRTSSPCTQDGSQVAPIDAKVPMQASADPTEAINKSQRQGSFLPSPIRDSPVPGSNAPPKVYGPPLMGGPLPPLNGPLPPAMRPPNGHPQPMIPPGPPFGPDACFRPPPHMDSYRPPFPLRPYGPPRPFVHGPPLRDFPPLGPHSGPRPIHEFPSNFPGPQDSPFPPRPFPPGPLPPPPGATIPPVHGPAAPTPPQPRVGQDKPHAPPEQQRAPHDAPPPSGAQS